MQRLPEEVGSSQNLEAVGHASSAHRRASVRAVGQLVDGEESSWRFGPARRVSASSRGRVGTVVVTSLRCWNEVTAPGATEVPTLEPEDYLASVVTRGLPAVNTGPPLSAAHLSRTSAQAG